MSAEVLFYAPRADGDGFSGLLWVPEFFRQIIITETVFYKSYHFYTQLLYLAILRGYYYHTHFPN